ARYVAPARADPILRDRRLRAAVRSHLPDAVHHHRGWARQCDTRPVDADLRNGVLLPEDGPGRGDLGDPLCHHDGVHGSANAFLHAARGHLRVRSMTRQSGVRALLLSRPARRWLGLLALAGLTFAFVLPILWMTTTSFQAGEKMFQLTTEWIPKVW